MYIHTYIRAYILHTYLHTYIHTYIHTHIRAYILTYIHTTYIHHTAYIHTTCTYIAIYTVYRVVHMVYIGICTVHTGTFVELAPYLALGK